MIKFKIPPTNNPIKGSLSKYNLDYFIDSALYTQIHYLENN